MIRAFQWDLARQVERLDLLRRLLPLYAKWGYQELYLHLEDAVHYPSLPGIARGDAYAYEALGALVQSAAKSGIRVVPIVNLLGHTQYLVKHPDLRDLNELRDERGDPLPTGQICPLHPRTLEVAARLLRDMAPLCTAGKVHVGLDESFHLGKCPRCREEVERIGLAGHFAGHVKRLHGLTTELGLQMGLWADMLYFVPQAISQLPAGIVAYDWYYYPFNRTPKVEFYNFAERDLEPALRRRGIHYYGCAMNGAFRHEPMPVFGDRLANIRSWWNRCQRVAAEGLLITSWEPDRLALETTVAVDAAAAGLWLDSGTDDATSLLAAGLRRLGGAGSERRQARALLAADEHAFSGYARWQINDRWDVFAGEESLKTYDTELKFYARLLHDSYGWSPAFRATLEFRHYLAQRDLFVRQAAKDVFKLRRLLAADDLAGINIRLGQMRRNAAAFAHAIRAGRIAARTMWNRSRDRRKQSRNEAILIEDHAKLKTWQRWLVEAHNHPRSILQRSPVCGAWQLHFVVHNVAPAVQKVIVDQREEDGTWREIGSRYTIEFRGYAARSDARISRIYSVPVDDPATGLRIRVAGVGLVRLSLITLTDGVSVRHALPPKTTRMLGLKPKLSGFPSMDKRAAKQILALRWR